MRAARRGVLLHKSSYDGPTEWVFTANGTFVAPVAGTYQVRVLSGGGGGGKGNSNSIGFGYGGGGGSFYHAQANLELNKRQQIVVTVGNGGSAAANGGASSFGSLLSVLGGGVGGNATTSNPGAVGSGTYGYTGFAGSSSAGGSGRSVNIGGISRTSGRGGFYPNNEGTAGQAGLVYIVLL